MQCAVILGTLGQRQHRVSDEHLTSRLANLGLAVDRAVIQPREVSGQLGERGAVLLPLGALTANVAADVLGERLEPLDGRGREDRLNVFRYIRHGSDISTKPRRPWRVARRWYVQHDSIIPHSDSDSVRARSEQDGRQKNRKDKF